MKKRVQDLTGQVFGRLTVIVLAGRKNYIDLWRCRCACGNEKTVYDGNLRQGFTKSCGCTWKKSIGDGNRTHGERTVEYFTWKGIKQRCFDKNSSGFRRYGGRGIRMCVAWARSYETFLRDMGRKPSAKHSIDRIENDLHYSCGKCKECVTMGWSFNCRWAIPAEQARNKRTTRFLTYNGKTMALFDWANETGLKLSTLWNRLDVGWPIDRALTEPVRRKR